MLYEQIQAGPALHQLWGEKQDESYGGGEGWSLASKAWRLISSLFIDPFVSQGMSLLTSPHNFSLNFFHTCCSASAFIKVHSELLLKYSEMLNIVLFYS